MYLYIGIIIILAVNLVLFFMNRRITLPFYYLVNALLIPLDFSYTVILHIILVVAMTYYKVSNREDKPIIYDNTVYSVSMIKNLLSKQNGLNLGRIAPTNKYELPLNKKMICLNDTILSGGTLVTGSTGSGKSTTLENIMYQTLDNGRPVVFCDYKGEEGILDRLKEYCVKKHIDYYEFSARDCNFRYDPLINLDETGRVEALMNTRKWDVSGADSHYKTSTQLAIQNIIREYDKARNDNSNYLIGLYRFALDYKPGFNERDGYNTLVKQLEILLSSKAIEMLEDSNLKEFSFQDVDTKPFVLCFSFTSANKQLANQLSSFIYQDLMDRGTKHPYINKLLLCIDEFGSIESSIVIKDILEKGRSAGVQTLVSIQDIYQIAMGAGEHFVQAMLGTINSFIIFAGCTQESAELMAGVQRFQNKDYNILALKKPYTNKHKIQRPTAAFITKYPILNTKGSQEMYIITPTMHKNKTLDDTVKYIDDKVVVEDIPEVFIQEEIIEPEVEDKKDTMTIDNISDLF